MLFAEKIAQPLQDGPRRTGTTDGTVQAYVHWPARAHVGPSGCDLQMQESLPDPVIT